MKMFWIGMLTIFQLWGSITGLQRTEKVRPSEHPYAADLYSAFVTALRDLKACKSLTLCELAERLKVPLQSFTKFSTGTSEKRRAGYHGEVDPRSYYSNYGAPAHTYVPAFLGFDPISILASLAFLAFLLQSFASLFDRSRSIIPTIVSSRQSPEATVLDIAERVFRAMERYETLNEKTSQKTTEKLTE
ncbi:uncharacterized protein LOC105686128 isoform X2 [Athalia rosae]|nr:uncharacterized protein LOC105686128 isoform X2 [Athalia rosae]